LTWANSFRFIAMDAHVIASERLTRPYNSSAAGLSVGGVYVG
jgi:hypothetical protein